MSRKMNMDRECGRCGKTTTLEVDMEGAKKQIELDLARDAAVVSIEEFASTLVMDEAPELIIIHRYGEEKDGFVVEVIDDLCSASDSAKRNRGCQARVGTLIDDIFARVERPEPKKKTTKKEKGETPAHEKGK